MGFISTRTWGYWTAILLFASPHSRMKGLAPSSWLDHELHHISQSSCRKEREKKKIHLLNAVLGMEHSLKFGREQYCFMGLRLRLS